MGWHSFFDSLNNWPQNVYRSIIYYLSMVLHSLFPKKQMVTQNESSNAMKRSTKEVMMDVLIGSDESCGDKARDEI